MTICYLNGEFLPLQEARVSAMDRGFLLGDGVYEILPAYRGRLFSFAEHYARLEISLAAIQLNSPHSIAAWQTILQELVDRNGGGDQSIYLQITRGPAPVREHQFPEHVTPTTFAYTTPFKPLPIAELQRGITAITLPDNRWQNCYIKSISLIGNVLLKQAAKIAGGSEAILIRDGFAIEGAASNLFIVSNGVIETPPADGHILRGITRDLIITLAKQNQIECIEKPITEEMLFAAEEIWISSSVREIVPVVRLNEKIIGDGKAGAVWQKIIEIYRKYQATNHDKTQNH